MASEREVKQEGPCDTCGVDLDEHSHDELVICWRRGQEWTDGK